MENRKCGIATITVGSNYGNRLQNYALQKVLKEMNIDAETIQYEANYPQSLKEKEKLKSKIRKNIKCGIKSIVQKINKRINRNKYKEQEEKRRKLFKEFNKKNIKYSEKVYNAKSNLKELNNLYDFFITGSDQVWNPGYEGTNEFYYLNFADAQKTIAYAPSFAVSEIPTEKIQFYKNMLQRINCLSVREEKGKDIIKELTGREATLVLDPTLLLKGQDWKEIMQKFECQQKYIATYFLGNLTSEKRKKIQQFARQKGFKVINIYDRNNIKSEFIGPAEFLGIIANAEYIFTDSFHGTVFSILFEKPFTVWERYDEGNAKSMNSRIENILKMLNLEKCQQIVDKASIDYNKINTILEEERQKSINYLRNSIEKMKE